MQRVTGNKGSIPEREPEKRLPHPWRASLVPAAAVIPAPIAYIKVVAVKKLVVGPWTWTGGPPHGEYCLAGSFLLVICCFGSREPGPLL